MVSRSRAMGPCSGGGAAWLSPRYIPVYTMSTPASPEPFCAVMPRAGVPEGEWPPFTEERLPGPWFWKDYWSRRIVSVVGLIAARPATVFWADTKADLGVDCCVVAQDLEDCCGIHAAAWHLRLLQGAAGCPPGDVAGSTAR